MIVLRREERVLTSRVRALALSQSQTARFSFRASRRWPTSVFDGRSALFGRGDERGAALALAPSRLCRIASAVTRGLAVLAERGPEESDELARDRDRRPCSASFRVRRGADSEPVSRRCASSAIVTTRSGCPSRRARSFGPTPGAMTVLPGGLDERAADVFVAGLRDAAARRRFAARVEARTRPRYAASSRGDVEALDAVQLGDEDHRDGRVDPAEAAQPCDVLAIERELRRLLELGIDRARVDARPGRSRACTRR